MEENHFFDDIFSDLNTCCPLPTTTTSTTRYTLLKSDEDVVHARESSVAASTKHDTNYCLKTWQEWANYRNTNFTVQNCSQLVPIDPALAEVDSLIIIIIIQSKLELNSYFIII